MERPSFVTFAKFGTGIGQESAHREIRSMQAGHATRIADNIMGETPEEMAEAFMKVVALNGNDVKSPGVVMVLCAPRGEKHSADEWQEEVRGALTAVGLQDNQYLAVRHDDSDIEHVHIVADRVGFDGTAISVEFPRHRLQQWVKGGALDKLFEPGQKVYVERGPIEFVGEVVSTAADGAKVTVYGVETGSLQTRPYTIDVEALEFLHIIDEKKFAELTQDEPCYMTRDRFMTLQKEREGLVMLVAEGKETDASVERLTYLDLITDISPWQMHPDYGCVRSADVPTLDAAEEAMPGKSYMGEIVAAPTPDCLLQNIGKDRLVLHDAAKLGSRPAVGERVTVQYDGSGLGRIADREAGNKTVAHVRD